MSEQHQPTKNATAASADACDPGIEEVRALRRELSERFGHDLARLGQHLRAIEQKHADRVVQPPDRSSRPRVA
jgi:hypothetical protein